MSNKNADKASSFNNDNRNDEPANKDTTASEKKKLLREINELKSIIKQCEWNLQTCFKDVEEHVTKKSLQSQDASSHFGRTSNVEVDLQNDLYMFAGFRCVKFHRNEFVFNFKSTNDEQKDNTQAVQIFVKDKKANLGKWVMPISVDMNYILAKTPINEMKNLIPFIKSCKHNVDCHTARQKQFLSLKEHISCMKHCTLQSDIGFKQISLELYSVHDNENDRYIDIVIHLLYHPDQARPFKVVINTTNKDKLSDDTKQRLRLCLKEFKTIDLKTAFDKILTEDNSTFTWMRTDDSEDSPLELNDTSNSDEEDFLGQLNVDRRRSLRKRQRKRELQKKWNERKRQRDKTTGSLEDSEEDNHSQTKVSCTESPQRIPITKKRKKATSISKQEKIKNLLEERTPMHKPKIKLKQTKLNFQTHEATSNTNEISLIESKLCNKPNSKQLKITELITSTPQSCSVNIRRLRLSPSLEINNITSIEPVKKTPNKLDNSKNSSQLENKIQKKTNRLVRSRTKTAGLQVSKTN